MEASGSSASLSRVPTLRMDAPWDWERVLAGPSRTALEAALAEGLPARRWFGSKARRIDGLRILEAIRWNARVRLTLVEVRFESGPDEIYQLPLAFASGETAERLLAGAASGLWARVLLANPDVPAMLFDASADPAFCDELLARFDSGEPLVGEGGQLTVWHSGEFCHVRGDVGAALPTRLLRSEQSNSSIIYGDRLILKLFRRVEIGLNPDVELNAHLTERGFTHAPPLAGAIEYRRPDQEPWALGMLQGYVPNRGDAWQHLLGQLGELFEQVADDPPAAARASTVEMLAAAVRPIPPEIAQEVASFLADAERLGQRTAEMHLALAAAAEDAAFSPQPLTAEAQQVFCERGIAAVRETYALLERQMPKMPAVVAGRARHVHAQQHAVVDRIEQSTRHPVEVQLIRCHGDYHLGQVLVTDHDFVIIDFEGEPARPLAERREKQFALRDVAGMIRSFHYASRAAAQRAKEKRATADAARLDAWAAAWHFWTSAAFLGAYCRITSGAVFVPASQNHLARLLDACLLEKAVYELRYELNNRPDWVMLPLVALSELVD